MNEADSMRANGFPVPPTPIPDRWVRDITQIPPTRPGRPDPSLTERYPNRRPLWKRMNRGVTA